MRGYTACASVIVGLWNGVTLAQSNIDSGHAFSWGENIGWLNWRCDPENGAVVGAEYLSGHIWAENVGWIDLGDGHGLYGNSDDTDFGVNLLPDGDLDGFAWGENIGWINFNTAGHAPDQARFDFAAGRFRGYAWGENTGWINLDDAVRFIGLIPPPPTPDADNPDKTRFVSFSVATTQEAAIRVWLTSLHHVIPPYTGGTSTPFALFEGQAMYVGPPALYRESGSSLPSTDFYASQLQCAPYYQSWSAITLLHVSGEAIVPSSTYNLENLAASCAGNEASCTAVSAALEIKTTRWADVNTPYQDPLSAPSQPDFGDISALKNKFASAPGAPIKARALLSGDIGTRGLIDISAEVNFSDISLCADAFQGKPYPYKPGKCSGATSTACTTNSDCGANGPCVLCP